MKTKLISRLKLGAAISGLVSSAWAQQADPALQDVIIVTGSRQHMAQELTVSPDAGPLQGGDVTYITARTPGGARIANGELSGQMQYRGLFGERLNLRVDGQRFASGGPNLMDPVFHYAPAPLVASIIIDRGVSPVSKGPGLAGGADAVFKRVGFSSTDAVDLGYDLTVGARSVNESVSAGGVVGAATDVWRFNLIGAYERADETQFDGGVIGGTQFERAVYGVSAGVKLPIGAFSLDIRRQETDPSGNPPFPMDIQYFNTDFIRVGYEKEIGAATLSLSYQHTDVAHLMDNFSLRPAPAPMRQRATFADATTHGGEVALRFPFAGGEMALGADGETVDHHARITNPNNANFFVAPFPDINVSRIGAFSEWNGDLGPVRAELGVRVDTHDYEAGEAVVGPALPMGPVMLANAFNGSTRQGEDTTVDGVIRLWTPASQGFSLRATLARKQQMPGYVQRFGWLPINASGGLADGNIYVGDRTLKPETAWIAEAGFDFADSRFYARPTVFYRHIDDYIQGAPFDETIGVIDSPVEMIANMNGDPTPLVWANVDARLYGFDMDAGYDFAGPLRIDGVFNYVRGERRDIGDNLYRIAPPNLTVGVTWEQKVWSATFEARAVADQNDVSLTNSEQPTSGYVVLGVYADWEVASGLRFAAGVENLLNENYQDHLSGYNRNGFGDVPVGERLPGAGRGVFLRLSLAN